MPADDSRLDSLPDEGHNSEMTTFILPMDTGGAGLRLAVKDLIDIVGTPTTAGSRAVAMTALPASVDAACLGHIRTLISSGQLRLVGKTNLHELAYGSSGRNDWYGTPVNPLDAALVPGGSSSGSAVAVAAGDADVAIGTDTGGSIRIPAACCGVCGLKTTTGRIPLQGVRPLVPGFDIVGPIARDVTGLALGMTFLDPTFSESARPAEAVGRIRFSANGLIDEAIDQALRLAEIPAVDIHLLDEWHSAWNSAACIVSYEAWRSNGHLISKCPQDVGEDVAKRLRSGASVPPADLHAARIHQHAWAEKLDAVLGRVAVLAMPTLAEFPPPLSRAQFDATRHTLPINYAGLPAVVIPVPCGNSVPASLQLVGTENSEEVLLATAHRIESALS